MLNGRPILKVLQSGVSFVCAHCEHFWWGIDNKHSGGCKAVFDQVECSGPIRGLAFPHYEGPLKDQLANYCFVCGHDPDAVAVARNGGARVGVCDKHIEVIEKFTVPGEKPPFITHVHVPVVT